MTMRQPTPMLQLLKWHRAALRGGNPPRHEDDPQCGWYRMRKVKNGPWVAVEIFCISEKDENGELIDDEYFMARINGLVCSPYEIWTYLTPISRAEYVELEKRPLRDPRAADPMKPIDLAAAPTLPERTR